MDFYEGKHSYGSLWRYLEMFMNEVALSKDFICLLRCTEK